MSKTAEGAHSITRRNFLKTTGAIMGAGLAAGSFTGIAAAEEGSSQAAAASEEIKYSNCRNACQGGCRHQYTVRDGNVVNAGPAPYPDPDYTSICLRGLSNVARTYGSGRVRYPMRRVDGTERGAGQWERISWDDAINEIAEKFTYYRDTFGGQSIVKDCQAGNLGKVNGPGSLMSRLAQCVGMTATGDMYDRMSCAGTYRVMGVDPYCFSNEPADVPNADMVIIWGTNPVYAAPHMWRFIRMAQDNGAKIICFDPDKSATAHKCDWYIPVDAGSDLYLVLAAINRIVTDKLYDEEFVRTHTNAPFLVNRDTGMMYVRESARMQENTGAVTYDIGGNVIQAKDTADEGDYYVIEGGRAVPFADSSAEACELEGSVEVDGVMYDTVFTLLKNEMAQYSVEDASAMTSVPAETIEQFIAEYTAAKAVTINCAYGMGQYQNGHLWFQAACIMQALTGNFIKHGTGLTGMCSPGAPIDQTVLTQATNPQPSVEIPSFHMFDVWRDQKFKGEDYPVKAMITAASNPMSNYCDQNRWFNDVFPNLEFWVVVDNQWSDSACYADIVLPSAYWLETSDIWGGQNIAYANFAERVLDQPLYESLPDSEIFARIGYAMGYTEDFAPGTDQDELIKMTLDNDASREAGWTWESLNDKHTFRTVGSEDDKYVIGGHWAPFPTAHGRLELYWENPEPRADFGQTFTDEEIRKEHLPYWRAPREAWKENEQIEQYPLVLLNVHERFRTHTQFFDNPLLNEIEPDPFIYVSPEDAAERGVKTGDVVECFNSRGHMVLHAVVDANVKKGDVRVPKGWQRSQFIEGGYSELNDSYIDPWGVSACFSDQLCDFRLWNN